jgi:hypothetical protein
MQAVNPDLKMAACWKQSCIQALSRTRRREQEATEARGSWTRGPIVCR